jgi:hypothetical protein
VFSDFLIEHGLEADPEDDHDFAEMPMSYSDTIGSVVSHYAELQRAMRPWEAPKPKEAPARVDPERRRSRGKR